MRLVVQRVRRASVRTGGEVVGEIGQGAAVLVGISARDNVDISDRMADKLSGLRYFTDPGGLTNLAIDEVAGAFLVVSQFTLYAELRRGRRPGFSDAAAPDAAEPLVERFVARLRAAGHPVSTGRFGAAMELELVNDGPFTLMLDSDRDLAAGPGQGT